MNIDRYKNYLTENTKPFLNVSGLTATLSLSLLLFSSIVLSAPFDYIDTTTQTVDEVVAGCPGGVSTVYNVTDNFTINDLNVGVIIEHTWRGDLEIFVQSPALTTAALIADNGGGVDNLNVLFDSDSATAIANVDHGLVAIYENQLFPPSAATALDVFDGENSVGSWVITVCDDAGGDVGEWTRSSLEFDGTLVPSELTVVKSIPINADGDGNGYISVGDVLTYTITATNTGTIALTNVVVNDPLIIPNSNTCPNVAVAGTCVLVGTYTVLAVDRLVGNILNTATADSDQTTITNSNTVHTVVGSDPVAEAESVFYMPLPEDDALTALLSIFPGPNVNTGLETCPNSLAPVDPISTNSSITILRTNTLIYYDHQEDGYEIAPNASAQVSTEIWGDGDISNGTAPGTSCFMDACDILNAGTIVILDNLITTGGPDIIDFDGGDKISATDTISMTKANWSTGPGTLLAGAFELYPTREWGTSYQIPVGQDIAGPTLLDAKYQYVGITIMAQQDGTSVSVDLDGDPGTLGDITVYALNEGQSQLVDGGVLVGATVESNFDVQVNIITGDVCANYEARFLTLFPTVLWDNSYYNPVGTAAADNAPVRTILYNPNLTDLTVLVQDTTGSSIVIVPAGSFFDYLQNSSTGARYCSTADNTTCDANGNNFYAIAAIDADIDTIGGSNSLNEDWGLTLVPTSSLSQQALVGLGFGQDPLLPVTENSSPVWVTTDLVNNTTPINGITLCVDYDNDGTDAGAPNVDPVTGQEYDITFNVNPFESTRLFDPDGDQTSLLVWVCDADLIDAGNAVMAVAWGQDPSVSSGGAPAIDVGTGVPNVSSIVLLKEGQLSNDVNGDGFPSIGDTITYFISVTNVGFVPVDGEVLTDTLPTNVNYVANSTLFNNGVSTSPIADSGVTPFPLDEGGVGLPGLIAVGNSFLVTFDVIVQSLPLTDSEICNNADINIPFESVTDEFCIDIIPRTANLGNFVWEDTDRDGIQSVGENGIEGVIITLLDNTGVPVINGIGDVITTTTAADGSWSLLGLQAGDYQVQFNASGTSNGFSYSATSQNQGVDAALDSDGAPNGSVTLSQTATFTLVEGTTNSDIDTGFYQLFSVLGNRVWLDLDADGVQDANEDGIANLIVSLTPPAGVDLGAGNGVAITTLTDTDGNYIFTNLPVASGYIVTVSNPPAGLSQSYDEDGTVTAHTSVVNLTTTNQEYMTADFGYNPPVGTLGDFIWSDVNGDGQQDPGEIGLPGITVQLVNSSNVVIDTAITDAAGRYLFTGVSLTELHVVRIDPASLPAGYTQTGDPDGMGAPDNQTTVPLLNTSNSYNLDADFGYQPPVVSHADIGDTIFTDLNGNGTQDIGELGIPGVTVHLLVDTTGNNIPDTAISSVSTDANGNYLFPSLPEGDTYGIVVSDSNNILNGYSQTADPDGGNDRRSTIINHTGDDLNQDFGFRPPVVGSGTIGDRIFHDVNANNIQDAGDQGLEGVTVTLFNQAGDYIGTINTDENGQYLFTGLDTTATYTVIVNTASLPNGGATWVNNIDPDGEANAQSILDLSLIPSGIDLSQDFGFTGASNNTIGGTLWQESTADGLLTDGSGGTVDETGNGIVNVRVVLRDSNGNIVASQITDVNGDFSFTGLPNGSYTVEVDDVFNELAHLFHTDGPIPGDDNNSQDDTGYAVAVSGGVTDTTADFGYAPVVTTPITLGYFKAQYNQSANSTTIYWTTVSETGNAGFEISYLSDNGWRKAPIKAIAAKGVYSEKQIEYSVEVEGIRASQWRISDIDIKGNEISHGPYLQNRSYGEISAYLEQQSIDWQSIREQHKQLKDQRQSKNVNKLNQMIEEHKQNADGEQQ